MCVFPVETVLENIAPLSPLFLFNIEINKEI